MCDSTARTSSIAWPSEIMSHEAWNSTLLAVLPQTRWQHTSRAERDAVHWKHCTTHSCESFMCETCHETKRHKDVSVIRESNPMLTTIISGTKSIGIGGTYPAITATSLHHLQVFTNYFTIVVLNITLKPIESYSNTDTKAFKTPTLLLLTPTAVSLTQNNAPAQLPAFSRNKQAALRSKLKSNFRMSSTREVWERRRS